MKTIIAFLLTAVMAVAEYPTALSTVWVYELPHFIDSIASDTLINGIEYQKVIRTGEYQRTFFTRTSGDSVLYLDVSTDSIKEHILYNFSPDIGEYSFVPIESAAGRNLELREGRIERETDTTLSIISGPMVYLIRKQIGQEASFFLCLSLGTCPTTHAALITCAVGKDTLLAIPEIKYPTSIRIVDNTKNQFCQQNDHISQNVYFDILGRKQQRTPITRGVYYIAKENSLRICEEDF